MIDILEQIEILKQEK